MPTLLCACALALFASEAIFAFDAAGQSAGGGPPAVGPPSIGLLPAAGQDPAERSARSIECAQKADAQRMEGKPRKRFLHECRSGV